MLALIRAMTRMRILGAAAIALVIALAVGALNYAGYVFSGMSIAKGATLTIVDARAGSDIYIDNEKRVSVPADTTSVRIRGLHAGAHDILVAHDAAWPWISTFQATLGAEQQLAPLQIAKDPIGTVVSTDEPLFVRAQELFATATPPTAQSPRIHSDTGAALWLQGSAVFVRDGDDTRRVLNAVTPVRGVAWYPRRDDTVIVAVSNGIFALDTHVGDTQNFQPLYKGGMPIFTLTPDDPTAILVRDGEHVFRITLGLDL